MNGPCHGESGAKVLAGVGVVAFYNVNFGGDVFVFECVVVLALCFL